MNKILLILIAMIFWACNKNSNEIVDDNSMQINAQNISAEYSKIQLQFTDPIVLDSVDWILYPLNLDRLDKSDKSYKSSYKGQSAYWNVAFFNKKTNQTHLLSDSLKMIINSIHPKNELIQNSKQIESYVFYTIATKDHNQDGELNFDDPNYLFYSDVSGQNFLQISPNNYDLISWYLIDDGEMILMQTRKDSNQNAEFDVNDEEISFVFDFKTKQLKQVFNNDFNTKVKKVLHTHWLKKD